MVKTNHSTLHTVNNIQQSACTQGSNDTTHRLSRRTANCTQITIKTSPTRKIRQKSVHSLLDDRCDKPLTTAHVEYHTYQSREFYF